MTRRRHLPSLSTPIILASIAVPIAIALLVGWTLVFAQKVNDGDTMTTDVTLLVVGLVAFVALMSVLVMFAIFLGQEILEVRRQDSFIDSVTHELKSPLASIKLALQTLGRPKLDAGKREVLRKMMLDDVDRLSAFVDDILQASRIAHDHDRLAFDRDAVALRGLVVECATQVSTRHGLPEGAVTVDVPEGLQVFTDGAAMTLVVRNLIDNAVKYSTEGEVEVRVGAREQDDAWVELEVSDRGIGIPRGDLKRVFHRFYRVPSVGVRARKGTGLGLFVVYALVRNLGGRVSAHSAGPGEGTTMRVRLPGRTRGQDAPAETKAVTAEPEAEHRGAS